MAILHKSRVESETHICHAEHSSYSRTTKLESLEHGEYEGLKTMQCCS